MIPQQTSIPEFSNSVTGEYRHYRKSVRPGATFDIADTVYKWYDIAVPERTIDDAVVTEAKDYLTSVAGDQPVAGTGGFVILHLCRESFYFLLLNIWRNDNELWQAVYAKDGGGFDVVPAGLTRAAYCVWELGPVQHERESWSRYLYSSRAADDRRTYVDDTFSGIV